jgi:hypothetical protein
MNSTPVENIMLLPSAERHEELQFFIAKDLSYTMRLTLAFTFMIVGFALQIYLVETSFWWGLPLVFCGVLLVLTHGYKNKVTKTGQGTWQPTLRSNITRIMEMNRKIKDWDKAFIDITCFRGAFMLILITVLIGGAGLFLPDQLCVMLVANAAVMLFPFWITGVRSILTNDQIVIKAKMLTGVQNQFELGKKEGEEFQYQMQSRKAKEAEGEIPHDIKAMVHFHNGPAEFLGLQMQVSINSVQGKDYPYYYCVLVGRPSLKGLSKSEMGEEPFNITYEASGEKEVDIVVIRQTTTRKSGYHTPQRTANAIFLDALKHARRIAG